MRKAQLALALSKRKVENLVAFIRAVVLALTDNSNFPDPLVPLAELLAAASELEEAERKKKTLGLANRKEKRKKAEGLLTLQGVYVSAIAKHNGAIMESAGMPLKRAPSPQPLPGEVRRLKIKDGVNEGEVLLTHMGTEGRNKTYYIEHSTDPNLNEKNWVKENPTGKLQVVIKGLKSGRRTAFRIRALNAAGFGPWSSVAFITIQ